VINGNRQQFEQNPEIISFGDYRIDFALEKLWLGQQQIDLPHLSYRLLAELVRSGSKPVSIKELSEKVWQTTVSGGAVKQRIKLLRQTLGDDANSPKYIENIRGQGYRLAIPVAFESDKPESTQQTQSTGDSPWVNSWVKPGVILGLICVLGSILWSQSQLSQELSNTKPLQFAVLPVKPIGSRNWTETLAAGIDAELSHALGQLPMLEMISLSSLDHVGVPDPTKLNGEFEIEVALIGALRYDTDRSRVVFELVDYTRQRQIAVQAFDLEPGIDLNQQKILASQVSDFVAMELQGLELSIE